MSELENFDDKSIKEFTVECPQCHEQATVSIGETECEHCHAMIVLEIE